MTDRTGRLSPAVRRLEDQHCKCNSAQACKRFVGNCDRLIRASYLGRDLDVAVRTGLPGDNRHLLLDLLHIRRALRLRAIPESNDALGIFADLLRPVLRKHRQSVFQANKYRIGGMRSFDSTEDLCKASHVLRAHHGTELTVARKWVIAGLTCSSRMTYLYSILVPAGNSTCSMQRRIERCLMALFTCALK